MADTYQTIESSISPSLVHHPLEPLTAEEITAAVHIVRTEHNLHERVRFASVALHEPPKEVVLNFKQNDPITREAFIILLDNSDGATYEAVVSITEGKVISWRHIPGGQPSIMLDEFFECEQAVKASPEFQAALRKRGITNFDLLMVDPWSAGSYGGEEEKTQRLSRALSWVRSDPNDNGYAHPIEGLIAVVDLNKMEVVRVEDYGVVPLPPSNGNYTPEAVGQLRADLKPLEITQPEGPSFTVNGHEVHWQKWHFRLGFTPREGVVFYTVGYEDQGRIRPILYRASLAEMVVPYGDPRPAHYRQNAFDVGEYGLGKLANALELGCDCLGHIHYFDVPVADDYGKPAVVKNAICLHEEDYGILWKHYEFRNETFEVRRSRRLVISFFTTVGNYDYGFFWYFYQDGTIQLEVKLTGIIQTAAIAPGEPYPWGGMVAEDLGGPTHQHFFNARLHMMLDGEGNTVTEHEFRPRPWGTDNPYGNVFDTTSRVLSRVRD